MPSKRKRDEPEGASTKSTKRVKHEEPIVLGDPGVWEVQDILQEKGDKYLIAWVPSASGTECEPTWERKVDVNQEAVDYWRETKRLRRRRQHVLPTSSSESGPEAPGALASQEDPPAGEPPPSCDIPVHSVEVITTPLRESQEGQIQSIQLTLYPQHSQATSTGLDASAPNSKLISTQDEDLASDATRKSSPRYSSSSLADPVSRHTTPRCAISSGDSSPSHRSIITPDEINLPLPASPLNQTRSQEDPETHISETQSSERLPPNDLAPKLRESIVISSSLRDSLRFTSTQVSQDLTQDWRNPVLRPPLPSSVGSSLLPAVPSSSPNQGPSSSLTPSTEEALPPASTFEVSSLSALEPPSQWPATFASAPPRPDTLSETGPSLALLMEEQPARVRELRDAGGPLTPAQRSIGMTTRSSVNRAASPAPSLSRDVRSPSVIPAIEQVQAPTAQEHRTSGRYPTLVPEQPADARSKHQLRTAGVEEDSGPSDSTVTVESAASSTDIVGTDTITEFAVPLFFIGSQRDTYKQTIVYHRELCDAFLTTSPSPTPSLLGHVQDFIDKLHHIESHPDLLNEESFTQADIEPAIKAQWDKDVSTKFRFLSHLLTNLVDLDMHVLIDIQQGRLLDILKTFLVGLQLAHRVEDSGTSFPTDARLKLTLLPKHIDGALSVVPDLVISFEGAPALIADQRRATRTHHDGHLAPLLYLVIPKTAEHIERCLASEAHRTMSADRRLMILLENVALLRDQAGYRSSDDQDSKKSAASLASWIRAGARANDYPLDDLPDLALTDPASSSQLSHDDAKTGSKRTMDDSPALSINKRLRIDEKPSTIDPSSLALSHPIDYHVVAASEYITDLEMVKAEYEKRLAASEMRNAEYENEMGDLQYRFESQREELIKTRAALEAATLSISTFQQQISSRNDTINKIKADRDALKVELAQAKQSRTSPDASDVDKMRASLETLEREKVKAEARAESARKEAEYVRSLYQEASTGAAALAEEKAEVEAKVADLEQKANSEATSARNASCDAAKDRMGMEIKRLTLMLADRDKSLQSRDEEIVRMKEKERGRIGTRAGSVPRSRASSPATRLEPLKGHCPGSRSGSPRCSPAISAPGKSRLGR